MRVVIIYKRNRRIAENGPLLTALVAAMKYMAAAAGILGGFFFTSALWTSRQGIEFSRAAADLAPVFIVAAIAYALALQAVIEFSLPRRGRSGFAGIGAAATFLGSFAAGVLSIKAALWLMA